MNQSVVTRGVVHLKQNPPIDCAMTATARPTLTFWKTQYADLFHEEDDMMKDSGYDGPEDDEPEPEPTPGKPRSLWGPGSED